ncbi:MAG: hypothetical protein CMK32_02115 [Porticoccaceae bacterium]|nr:hypothetical protein [Porticoccaceae bacterium]
MEEFFCRACLAQMPTAKFALGLSVAVIAALAGLLLSLRNIRRARLIEDMPTSRIRSASQGYVELMGLASAGETPMLRAPLTDRPCLWWRYTIEKQEKSGKSTRWRVIEKGQSPEPFQLDDGTGLCRIEPAGAEIRCQHRQRWHGSERRPGAASRPITARVLGFGGRFRYTEFRIRDGDPLYILGHFVSDATGQRVMSVDQIAGRLIRQWKQDFRALLARYDEDRDGNLDPHEWRKVTEAARTAAVKVQQHQTNVDQEHSIRRPDDGRLPYLIGSQGQEQLSRHYRWRALATAVLFLAAGALATWMIGARFPG